MLGYCYNKMNQNNRSVRQSVSSSPSSRTRGQNQPVLFEDFSLVPLVLYEDFSLVPLVLYEDFLLVPLVLYEDFSLVPLVLYEDLSLVPLVLYEDFSLVPLVLYEDFSLVPRCHKTCPGKALQLMQRLKSLKRGNLCQAAGKPLVLRASGDRVWHLTHDSSTRDADCGRSSHC